MPAIVLYVWLQPRHADLLFGATTRRESCTGGLWIAHACVLTRSVDYDTYEGHRQETKLSSCSANRPTPHRPLSYETLEVVHALCSRESAASSPPLRECSGFSGGVFKPFRLLEHGGGGERVQFGDVCR